MVIVKTIFLLLLSNCFMIIAWYGHLKFKSTLPLLSAIFISWFIAFFEYIFQVPANRLGYGILTAYQLKLIQECINLIVFIGFATLYMGENFQIKYGISMLFILAAMSVAFYK